MATASIREPASILPDRMLIGGKLIYGTGTEMTVTNPSSGEVAARFKGASVGQFDRAIADARASFDKGDWANRTPAHRIAVLQRFQNLLIERMAELRALILIETGTPIGSYALMAQVESPLRQNQQLLDLYPRLPEIEENPITLDERVGMMGGFVQSLRRYVPIGVVAGISAYNFPLHISLWKMMPALLTGNSVVLRPSPLTPLATLALGEIAIEAGIPAGVLSIVAEGGAEGASQLTTDPRVDLVTFTGSTDIGKKVVAQGAATMKRVHLELGGKSAQIFMPDKVEAAYGAAAVVCMSHAGQGCVLGTRVFVPLAEKAKVLEAMKASLANARIGDSDDPSTTMGPVISAGQVERCERYVRLAVEAGATVVTGGKRADRPGFYFEPTVLDLPDNKNPAAQDEIFGPVIGVIGYRDIEHAIEMANDSHFGLSGYVHGRDARAALEVAKRIRSGTVNVNAVVSSGNASSGGHKTSGLGRERGVEGIRAFQEIQVLNLGN